MTGIPLRAARVAGAALGVILSAGLGLAEAAAPAPAHGIAMYGDPALPPDFVALPYANPDAPKGGRIVLGETGSFDSLNPFLLKGTAPWALGHESYESLMGRSWDEPFTLYGLLAETVTTGPNRDWVEFTLRPEARFSDGSPVTVEDVLWSVETLGTLGHPRYRNGYEKIARAEAVGPRSVRFTFNAPDRELPLILGLRPILKKAQWEGRDFTRSGLEPPIGSGPYVVSEVEPGRFVSLRRNPDYWGRDLPFNRGQHNFDVIRHDYYADGAALFAAFTAGEVDIYRETNDARWQSAYDFPAVRDGRIVKAEIPHHRPSGISGLAMNTRRPVFADWRVRDAMILAFNFEFINQTLTGGTQPRIASYFSNSELGMRPGPAEGKVRALLAPFADSLLPGALDGYALPVSDGRPQNRRNLRAALARLAEAGWTVGPGGRLRNDKGAPFRFEILLVQGASDSERIVTLFADALQRMGIEVRVTQVDAAQYVQRTASYDFDMTVYARALSLSPGNEQWLYWGAAGVTQPGTGNWMGIDSPAAEAMIRSLLNATGRDDFIAATRALDRVLTTGRYVIPIWYAPSSHLAHAARLHYPGTIPVYGDWVGFLPDVWWSEEN
ncbi:extracellular solute-binding protein [Rhodovulum visakhapatnamense]|uniref:Peptide/nickel transport system substrate-binding protein n=1 Tax=Rhodovulum visakhapatnamense TaxID=364297 RepID=A0A4R8G2Y4_9RHOB|nr:extracellular solute-binding protein [Rhodovulum visakhapatnamense]TDX33830.1 peptide/nickel transport system substrate-binding protein [Rhodovulum visakhapatnamense]